MPKLIILVGPPGSGKTTYAKEKLSNFVRISQDDQGKHGYIEAFRSAVEAGADIIVDRMNFSADQRRNFIQQAPGYYTKVIVLHESHDTCLERMLKRENHPTIKDEKSARAALHTFFTKYERPLPNEFQESEFIYPEGPKPLAIVCDLDGTLCNVEHRRHFVRREGKKYWKGFFDGIVNDTPNVWCLDILVNLMDKYKIVYCSGRGQEYEEVTKTWLDKHAYYPTIGSALYMRHVRDSRQDYIVKEIILDFEILTRYTPHFMIDDRTQVVDMWRRRGFTCLQCDEGNF